MAIKRGDAETLMRQLRALASPFGQDEVAWATAICNVLVSADDLDMARKAVSLIIDEETARPAPAGLRGRLDSLRALLKQPVASSAWKNCSCNQGWVIVRRWINGFPYDFAGKCSLCQQGGTARPDAYKSEAA